MTTTIGPAVDLDERPGMARGPRELLLGGAASALDSSELLAIVLGTGSPPDPDEVPGVSCDSLALLAHEFLERAGGLRPLALRLAEDPACLPGVSPAHAARIAASLELGRRLAYDPLPRGAIFRDAADVFRHYHPAMRDLRLEQFRVLLLDGKHRVIREELISQGTLTSSPVHPREVFAPAIRHSAAAIVLVHNHPSGDPSPSADDLAITTRLGDVGALVGIRVLDHVIVGDGSYASLSERGLIASR